MLKAKLLIAFSLIIMCLGFTGCFEIGDIEIADIDFKSVKTGTYTATCDKKIVKATVTVEVENNRVTNIQIIKHECGKGKKAEVIVKQVIDSQSLMVETITGATGSSKVILKAIESALKQGLSENRVPADSLLEMKQP
ncbi:FMN-binding protein [candidate division KSB1 bacterium]|nr:FMN-binding protein [candidate division KSB1 bacterium]